MEIQVKYWENDLRKNHIIKAVNIINGLQNYYYLTLEELTDNVSRDAKINWEKFRKELLISGDEYIIFITEKPFVDNWFSHEEDRFSVITSTDWEELFAPPSLKAYLIYQIAQSLINFEGDLSEKMSMRIVHDRAQGCMFDFCEDKSDIHLGMVAGNICPECRSVLTRYGICERAIYSIERILDYVRSESIGKPMLFNENAAFVVMRFSQNDENDHAYFYGIKEALKALDIKCVRADDQVISGQLLEKVKTQIENSRFIIAKVDSNNLNVYFELGLALGLKKDVLLISEKSMVLQLPSDLRNWECLTYTEGNYIELRDKIINFFSANYHYKPLALMKHDV
ncbi:MAG: nucleotide-binding protein [Ruminococcus sp.]|nr:nucleotide-binding protein [Ruminococcus sp.]